MLKKKGIMNYDPEKYLGVQEFGPTKTVPGHGMTIRQIFDKYRISGQVPSVLSREGFDQEIDENEDPENLPDLEKLAQADHFDRAEAFKQASEEANKAKGKLDALGKAAEAKKLEKQKELDETVKYAQEQKAKRDTDKKRTDEGTKE